MYAPFWSVTSVVDVFRLTLRIVTWAPGTSCPVESSTVPAMLPVETCAAAGAGGESDDGEGEHDEHRVYPSRQGLGHRHLHSSDVFSCVSLGRA